MGAIVPHEFQNTLNVPMNFRVLFKQLHFFLYKKKKNYFEYIFSPKNVTNYCPSNFFLYISLSKSRSDKQKKNVFPPWAGIISYGTLFFIT